MTNASERRRLMVERARKTGYVPSKVIEDEFGVDSSTVRRDLARLTAGAETDAQILSCVKDAVPGTAVLCNTGCCIDNVERQLSVSDGAVVDFTFKIDGVFENAVDPHRVKTFMDKVKSIRNAAPRVV
ncbi:hypothetical protein OE766_21070 [Pararhizobium sp. YC-54]|uniref:BtpA/SgcQ family protein n=1 Tax=Pararhizobium sp. YC-54 TaxID=2986920 RepID=UPI0021F6CCD6|nr:BtpA/SgcQ family protein [Pararhizobium sp. YC-54]MCW0000727.1 hypothetical protein [Pararhizobium sp. YC-54]